MFFTACYFHTKVLSLNNKTFISAESLEWLPYETKRQVLSYKYFNITTTYYMQIFYNRVSLFGWRPVGQFNCFIKKSFIRNESWVIRVAAIQKRFVNAFLLWPNNILKCFLHHVIFIQRPLVWTIKLSLVQSH